MNPVNGVSHAGAFRSLFFLGEHQTSRPRELGRGGRMTVEARPLQFRAAMEAQSAIMHPTSAKSGIAHYLYCERAVTRQFASTNDVSPRRAYTQDYIGVGLR